jgi:hypothetical protein
MVALLTVRASRSTQATFRRPDKAVVNPDPAVERPNFRGSVKSWRPVLVQNVQAVQPLRSVQTVFRVALVPRAHECLCLASWVSSYNPRPETLDLRLLREGFHIPLCQSQLRNGLNKGEIRLPCSRARLWAIERRKERPSWH